MILFLFLSTGQMRRDAAAPPPAPRSHVPIGVGFATDDPSGELRITTVTDGWPADRAGIRPGDRIVAVDGEAAATRADFRRLLGDREGVTRVFTIRRGAETLSLGVALERKSVGLFEPLPGPVEWWDRIVRELWAWVAILLIIGVAMVRGRRTKAGAGARMWLGFLAAMVLGQGLAFAAAVLLVRAQGGLSKGTYLVAMGAQVAGLLAGAAIASKWVSRPAAAAAGEVPLAGWKTTLLGLYYFVTGMIRLIFLVHAVDVLLLGGRRLGATDPIEEFFRAGLGTPGSLALLSLVVLVGPIAEEAVFRGYLLPRLRDRLGGWWALAASSLIFALLHPDYRLDIVFVAYMGAILGWARLRSGGMDAPIVLHVAFNALASFQMILGGR